MHVFGFRVSGLIQEYGWNAVALTLDYADNPVDFDESMWTAHAWSEYSQTFAPFRSTLVTCVLEEKESKLTLLVEQGDNRTAGKRGLQDAEWYQPTEADRYDQLTAGLWRKTYTLPNMPANSKLRMGVRMMVTHSEEHAVRITDPSRTWAWKEFVALTWPEAVVYA